jgi:hypothetical protein
VRHSLPLPSRPFRVSARRTNCKFTPPVNRNCRVTPSKKAPTNAVKFFRWSTLSLSSTICGGGGGYGELDVDEEHDRSSCEVQELVFTSEHAPLREKHQNKCQRLLLLSSNSSASAAAGSASATAMEGAVASGDNAADNGGDVVAVERRAAAAGASEVPAAAAAAAAAAAPIVGVQKQGGGQRSRVMCRGKRAWFEIKSALTNTGRTCTCTCTFDMLYSYMQKMIGTSPPPPLFGECRP